MRPVVFDIDGVLADFHAGYTRVARDLGITPPAIGKWNDWLNPVAWKAIRSSADFWMGLPPLVSDAVFGRIANLRDIRDVYFATSRVGLHALWQSARWLGFHGINAPSVIITRRKGEFAKVVDAAFLIDDKAGNAVYTAYESPKTVAVLLNAAYNQFDHDTLGSQVRRVQTVDEFLDMVEQEGS